MGIQAIEFIHFANSLQRIHGNSDFYTMHREGWDMESQDKIWHIGVKKFNNFWELVILQNFQRLKVNYLMHQH